MSLPSRRYAPAIDDRPDDDLVDAACAGDRAALEHLLRRHHDRIAALCRRMCGNEADGADATQEALIALVRGLPRFDGRSAFSTWSYRVAVNACLDELRRRKRRPLPFEAVESATADRTAEPTVARIDIDAALAQVPPDLRAAVVLRDLCGLDYTEIADTLGIPPGTVRSRIARGRARLADLLTGNPAPVRERPTP